MRDKVNLDQKQSDTAKSSQDWMIGQLEGLNLKDSSFPSFWSDMTPKYGSFKRKTKHRELDDIDTLFVIPAHGITYSPAYSHNNDYTLTVPSDHVLYRYTEQYTDSLSSIKIINKILKGIEGIQQYQSATTKRNGSAAVMKLSSYPWAFDIVPAFYTSPETDGRQYYLIPNGKGNWMKTDPRIDQKRITDANQRHKGAIIPAIRLFKRWAKMKWGFNMPSYLLETLIINYYVNLAQKDNYYVDVEFKDLLGYLAQQVLYDTNDPKGILMNINYLSRDERRDLSSKLNDAYGIAKSAVNAEITEKDHIKSIKIWKSLLGEDFAS